MNLRRLVLLLTSPSFAITAYAFVCSYALIIRSSNCICNILGSILLSAFTSTISVSMPGLLTLPLLVCNYAWVVRFSVCVCCVLRSVLPSTSAFAISVFVPGLLTLLLLCLWLCLGCPLLYLCLLYV